MKGWRFQWAYQVIQGLTSAEAVSYTTVLDVFYVYPIYTSRLKSVDKYMAQFDHKLSNLHYVSQIDTSVKVKRNVEVDMKAVFVFILTSN